MIFDSVYDIYRGVITYIRVIDGKITPRERIQMMSTRAIHELLEVGVISPEPIPTVGLGVGEVGYLITGVKDVRQSKVGDTITSAAKGATVPLGGYREPKPDGLLRALPAGRVGLPAAARRAGQAAAQRRRADLRAGDLRRARFRLPLRLSRAAAPGDHPGPPRTGIRPRPDLHGAERRLPRSRWRTAPSTSSPTRRDWPAGKIARDQRADRQVHDHHARASTSARSWSCASPGEVRWAAWTICPSRGSSCGTRCRSARSSSTSSTR